MASFSRKRTPGSWWSVRALLGPKELSQALGQFSALCIYRPSSLASAGKPGWIPVEEYISNYKQYIDTLTGEQEFDCSVQMKLYVSLNLDATNRSSHRDTTLNVLQHTKPAVQVQELQLAYLPRTNRVRVNCLDTRNPIHFGLMFSHPNVWNVRGADLDNPYDLTRFPNIPLIEGLTEWVQGHTKPCKIMVGGQEQMLGVRLGRDVLRWINEHDGLARQSIVVKTGRHVVADPSWLTPTVRQVARAIDKDRSFGELPVLADALEEAGCTDTEILDHCRRPKHHARGCWVVDMILSKA